MVILSMRMLPPIRPSKPSRHGESDESDDDNDVFHDTVVVDEDKPPVSRLGSERHSFCDIPRIDYSADARESIDPDNPKLTAAMESPDRKRWYAAIVKELVTITSDDRWVENSSPPEKISRYKVRLVALGNFQLEFYDYVELYAPVASIELVRLIMELVVQMGHDVSKVDAIGAFLHSLLPESDEIYVRLPDINGIPTVNG